MNNNKQYFVYLTINLINNKKYIGYHCGYENDTYLGSGTLFKKAIIKYGKNNFKRIILEVYPNEEAAKQGEKIWIKKYNAVSSDEFYNLAEGGEGNGTILQKWLKSHPEESKKFKKKAGISAKQWQQKNPQQAKNNIQKAVIASQEWYKEHPEQRLKNYEAIKKWNDEHPEERKKINQENAIKANEWYAQHPEARAKWHQAALDGFNKWKQEHPEKLQEKINNTIEKQGMKIRCITTGIEFRSQGEAARFYGMTSTSHLSACLKGKRKHAGKLSDGTKLAWEKII